ncbi:hypothetical protein FQZ97_549890 [compost metagenome]
MRLRSSAPSRLAPDRPTNTSAPSRASDRVRLSVSWANTALYWFRSSRPAWITPLRSIMKMFSTLAPMLTSSFMQEMAAAPAPRQTILASARVLPAISRALSMPAAVTMAVPCWSSWKTGMSHCSIRVRSISKHSGALMSSRLMPPKVMEMRLTVSMKACGLSASTSMSNTSIPAKRLNSTPLPSITGLEASGPRLPRPRIAVPSEITATRLPLPVYLKASSGSRAISRTGSATPGL